MADLGRESGHGHFLVRHGWKRGQK